MNRHRVSVWRILGFMTGICIVLLLILRPWHRPERSHRPSRDRTPPEVSFRESGRPWRQIQSPETTPAADSVVRFGILGPSAGASEWYYPLAEAIKCIKASGCPCEVVAPPGRDSGSLRSLLQGEGVNVKTCSFDAALERLSVLLVVLKAEATDHTVSKLRA